MGYGTEDRGFCSRQGLNANPQTDSGIHAVPYSIDIRAYLPEMLSGRGTKLNPQLHVVKLHKNKGKFNFFILCLL